MTATALQLVTVAPPAQYSSDQLATWITQQSRQSMRFILATYQGFAALTKAGRWQQRETYRDQLVAGELSAMSIPELWRKLTGYSDSLRQAIERGIDSYGDHRLQYYDIGAIERLFRRPLAKRIELCVRRTLSELRTPITETEVEKAIEQAHVTYPPLQRRRMRILPEPYQMAERIQELTNELGRRTREHQRALGREIARARAFEHLSEETIAALEQAEDQTALLRKAANKGEASRRAPALRSTLARLQAK